MIDKIENFVFFIGSFGIGAWIAFRYHGNFKNPLGSILMVSFVLAMTIFFVYQGRARNFLLMLIGGIIGFIIAYLFLPSGCTAINPCTLF